MHDRVDWASAVCVNTWIYVAKGLAKFPRTVVVDGDASLADHQWSDRSSHFSFASASGLLSLAELRLVKVS